MVKTARTSPAVFFVTCARLIPNDVRVTVQQQLPGNLSAEVAWSARGSGATDFGTAWLSRHTLRKSQMHEKNPLLRPNKRAQTPTLSQAGIAMIWSTHLRCAEVALFAMAVSYAVSAWAIPSARAFTMENLSTGGNTTRFAEPDGPANNFGRGAQPFGPGGPMVQFGARQGQLTPFSRSPGSGYNSTPPEPYARPLGNGD